MRMRMHLPRPFTQATVASGAGVQDEHGLVLGVNVTHIAPSEVATQACVSLVFLPT